MMTCDCVLNGMHIYYTLLRFAEAGAPSSGQRGKCKKSAPSGDQRRVFPKSDPHQTYTRSSNRRNADVVSISGSWLNEFGRKSQKIRTQSSHIVL